MTKTVPAWFSMFLDIYTYMHVFEEKNILKQIH